MKILVTGGTGFIGTNLIEQLVRKQHQIKCIAKDLGTANILKLSAVQTTICDINNGANWRELLSDVSYVYHLAGITRARESADYYKGNFEATKRLIDLCIKYCSKLKRFIYVSSLTAIGPSPCGEALDETAVCHPVSHYGKSKLMAEKAVLREKNTIPVTIVRPSAVYGPRDRDMYRYFKLIAHRIHPIIGLRKKRLNLIHVNDLVNGIILAAEHPSAVGETYFLGSIDAYTNEEIGEAIAQVLHKHPIRIRIPHPFIFMIGAIAQLAGKINRQQIFFNLQKAREAVQNTWHCSIKKAQLQIGFYPMIPLLQGMRETYLWYVQNKWL
jgi:nucleoside-diphosphate-sugar epimerase